MEAAPTHLDLASEVIGFEKLADFDFCPDGEHVAAAVTLEGGNRSSLVWRLLSSTHATLNAQIEHEKAVNRWEYRPPTPGGMGAATAMGMSSANPFEKVIRFSPDGRMLATVSHVDDFVRVWDWRSGNALTPPLGRIGRGIVSFAFSPDGSALAVATRDRTIRLWEIACPNGDFLPFKTKDRVDTLRFSADGNRLVYEGYEPSVTVLNLSPQRVDLLLKGHNEAISALAFSKGERYMATGSYDQTARVYDTQSGLEICSPLLHEQVVNGLAFHSDSKLLTFVSKWEGPSAVRVWEIPSGLLLHRLKFSDRRVEAAAFNPDGSR
ncbi:MAG: hypothetical protein JSW39_16075, partial [Desulfobacterales bacterium]